MLLQSTLSESPLFTEVALQNIIRVGHWERLMDLWGDDTVDFVRREVPKIIFVVIVAYGAIIFLRWLTKRIIRVRETRSGVRSQQALTLAKVVRNVGRYLILIIAGLEILALFGLNPGPLLASAGIVGLAIGFGSQALVKDILNGFFILLDDQYGLDDVIRVAGVRGKVEDLSLRRTILRDSDGTLHTIPNSEIRVVSNETRDWTMMPISFAVDYREPSERVRSVIEQVCKEFAADPVFGPDLQKVPELAGLDRIVNGDAEYLLFVTTKPTRQFALTRELRQRLKDRFLAEGIQAEGSPQRLILHNPQTSPALPPSEPGPTTSNN